MNNHYADKIKVVREDLVCFAVDPETLEAVGGSQYDPWAWSHPEPGIIETISVGEWNRRCYERFERELREKREELLLDLLLRRAVSKHQIVSFSNDKDE